MLITAVGGGVGFAQPEFDLPDSVDEVAEFMTEGFPCRTVVIIGISNVGNTIYTDPLKDRAMSEKTQVVVPDENGNAKWVGASFVVSIDSGPVFSEEKEALAAWIDHEIEWYTEHLAVANAVRDGLKKLGLI